MGQTHTLEPNMTLLYYHVLTSLTFNRTPLPGTYFGSRDSIRSFVCRSHSLASAVNYM